MLFPEKEVFLKHTRYDTLPIYKSYIEDCYTPIGLFEKLKSLEPTFLLESAGEHQEAGRYSYIGIDTQNVTHHYENIKDLKQVTKNLLPDFYHQLPPFINGFIGYLNYDSVENLFDIDGHNNGSFQILFCKTMLVLDHYKNQLFIVYNGKTTEQEYEGGLKRIQEIESLLSLPHKPLSYKKDASLRIYSNMDQLSFMSKVNKAKEYIVNGDIFQVVLSQQFSAHVEDLDSFELYKSVRRENPSPYLSYIKLEDRTIICSSPEMLIKYQDHKVQTVPIAGTRSVKHDGKDDLRAQELLNDQKELAEHLMLVDLGRNDIGKISNPSSVQVTEYAHVKKFSKVMHLVSKVSGDCQDHITGIDALLSAFPAGTVSGAPKKRALEIIHELEPTPRDLYAGSIFYLNANGNMNSCIAIRTIQIKNETLTIQAGAGIVYDSKPEDEYKETLNKASALFKALENLYQGGLYYDFSHR